MLTKNFTQKFALFISWMAIVRVSKQPLLMFYAAAE